MTSFSARSDLPELMDTDCRDFEDYRACLRDLSRVNVWTLTYRPTLSFLRRAARPGEKLSVLDVASGYGDMLRRIRAWGRRSGAVGRLAGIDLNPWAIRAAREAAPDQDVEFINGDAFAIPAEPRWDLIICAQFTHHLDEAGIVRFLRWLEANAARGWFVSDLHRHPLAWWGFAALSRVMGWHRFVRHDGLVSVRRSFSRADWRRMIAEAGLDESQARIRWFLPFRLCVSRLK
jgi:SAM-dependent methyltransferase